MMKLFGYQIGKEQRASPEDPRVPVSSENFLAFFGVESGNLPSVTIESALRVPAVSAAVFFLSRTMATLPLHAYKTATEGPQKVKGKLQAIIHDNPNAEMDRFKCWQYFWQQVFTGGRGLAWIERSASGVEGIWPVDPRNAVIKMVNGKRVYRFNEQDYSAADVIDVPFALKPNQLNHYSPIMLGSKAIQLALAMGDYASNFFAGGGVPPLAMSGPLPVGKDGMTRAMADVGRAIDAAKASSKPIFPMPPGYELKQVGFDPEKGQMTDARRLQIEEIARIYQLPPVFLQDLTRATFNNSEQQDLHLVKHLIGQWAQALEGEMNLKLFGQFSTGRYVEHNLDGLLRGDFSSRMAGYGVAIQNGIRSPDEVRSLENLPAKGGPADSLYLQGATVPLGTTPANAGQTAANPQDGGANGP